MRRRTNRWRVVSCRVVLLLMAALTAVNALGAEGEASLASWMPDETVAAVLAKPSQLIARSELEILGNTPVLGQFPIPPDQITDFVLFSVIDPRTGSPQAGLILRTREALFIPTMARWLLNGQAVKLESKVPTYRAASTQGAFQQVAVPDSRTVLAAGSAILLEAMLEKRRGSLIGTALSSVPADVDVAILVDLGQMRSSLLNPLALVEEDSPLGALALLPREAGMLAGLCRFGKRHSELTLTVAARDDVRKSSMLDLWLPSLPSQLERAIQPLASGARRRLSPEDGEHLDELMRMVLAAVKQLQVESTGDGRVLLRAKVASITRLGQQAAKLLLPAVQIARNSARAMQASNHFKQVALAWFQFHDQSGAFPSDITSADGKPLLSWRVRVLPFLGSKELQQLHAEFRLNEPWDSAHNSKLIARMPLVYQSPSDKPAAETRMQAISGPGCVLPGPVSTRMISDGSSNTAMLVEAAVPVPWTKPADIPWSAQGLAKQLHRNFAGESLMTMMDGATRRLAIQSDEFYANVSRIADGTPLVEQSGTAEQRPRRPVAETQKLQFAMLMLNAVLNPAVQEESLRLILKGEAGETGGLLAPEFAFSRMLDDPDADVRTAALLAYVSTVERGRLDWSRMTRALERASSPTRVHLLEFLVQTRSQELLPVILRSGQSALSRPVAVRILSEGFSSEVLAAALSGDSAEDQRLLLEALRATGRAEQLPALESIPRSSPAFAAAQDAIGAIKSRVRESDPNFQQRQNRLHAERRHLWNAGQTALRAAKPAEAIQSVRKMVEIEEELFGKSDDEVLSTLNWLANTAVNSGDTKTFLEMHRIRRDRIAARHGEKDPRTLEATANYELFRRRQELSPELRARDSAAINALERAGKASQEKKPDEALAAFREAAEGFEAAFGAETAIVANCLRDLRQMLVLQKKYAEAIPLAERVVKIDRATLGEDHLITVDDATELAFIMSLSDSRLQSFVMMRELLPGLMKHGRHANAAVMLDILGREMTGTDLSAAKQDLSAAIEMADLAGDEVRAASMSALLGRIARAQGNLTAAEAWWFAAQWRFREIDPIRGALEVLPDLAVMYRNTGRSHLELAMNQLVVQWLEKIPRERRNPNVWGAALTRLAGTQVSLGDYEQAGESIRSALAVIPQGPSEPWVIEARQSESSILEHFGDVAGARKALLAASEIARGLSPSVLATCRTQEAQFEIRHGNAAAAVSISRPLVSELIKQPNETTIEVLQTLAQGLIETGQLDEARTALRTAADLLARFSKQPLSAERWLQQARLGLRVGEKASVRNLCEQALARSRAHAGPESVQHAEILSQAAILSLASGDPRAAGLLARQSLDLSTKLVEQSAYVLSPRQQIGLTEAMRRSLDVSLSASLESEGTGRDIFNDIYHWKGATLLRQRLLQKLRQQEGVLPFYEQLAKVTAKLASTSRRPAQSAAGDPAMENAEQLAEIQEFLETQLSASRLAFLDFESDRSLDDLFQALGKEDCLVDYFVFQRHTSTGQAANLHVLATVVRGGRVQASKDLGPLDPIRKAVETWRTTLGRSDESRQAGMVVRSLVWDPILPDLTGAETVLISPDGPLGAIPFAALPQSDGRFLIETQRLATVPAPQLLSAGESPGVRSEPGRPLLAVGDLDYGSTSGDPQDSSASRPASRGGRGGQQFDPIPGTASEIEAIRQLMEKRGLAVDVLSQRRATEVAFREQAPRYQILHVATHGFFADPSAQSAEAALVAAPSTGPGARVFDSGLLSGLAMSSANTGGDAATGDGILTASEIATIDLSGVDLAVLSACETGLGKEVTGEGLLGIQRAFQVAGARSTVSSLWKVNDHTTQVLMARFYANRSNGMTDLDALREAQIWMLRHPQEVWSTRTTAAERGDQRVKPKSAAPATKQLDPEYWAAFTLSGHSSNAARDK